MENIYSTKDVCEYLGIGKPKLYELIAQKKIIAYKVGKAYKITETALNNFVKTLSV